LNHNPPRTVRELMLSIAESDLALVRNDVYGRGGVATQLEAEMAELLGQEAAVLMPSGTMAQQIALRIWSDGSGIKTVAFHPTSHLEIHENMAYRELHGLKSVMLGERERLFTARDVDAV